MKNRDYWKKRFDINQQNLLKPSDKYMIELERAFKGALNDIEKETAVWYQRFADNNGITDMSEARRLLTSEELKELKWNVNEYIKHGKENGIAADWSKELENASARYHISRLQALELQTRQQIETLYSTYFDSTDGLLKNTYKNSYYRTGYETAQGTGIGTSFSKIDERKLQRVMSKPWSADGTNFSEKIWNDRTKLVNTLHNELTRGIISGKKPDEIIKNISKSMSTSYNNAKRLVMTESAFFSSAGQLDAYKELNVEKYEILGTFDTRFCSLCEELDGKVFELKDFQAGVTAPPFHPNCRCTTIPYFDDEFTAGEQRAARDENGKTIYVDSKMSYEEWKEKFVNIKDDESGGDIRDKIKNILGIKQDILKEFHKGLKNVKNEDVRKLLEQSEQRVKIVNIKIENESSRFNSHEMTVYLNKQADAYTIAHELFHEIDYTYGITYSGMLAKEIQNDWKHLQGYAEGYGKSIEDVLYSKYPEAFIKTSNGNKLKEKYKGISDILNGMSLGKIKFGFGHKESYWKNKPLALEKETWAQFGRILYDNDQEVIAMTKDIFNESYNEALRILKEMIK